jgi:hypothetical protein
MACAARAERPRFRFTDVAGLTREAAVELMRWSAGALFEAAVLPE